MGDGTPGSRIVQEEDPRWVAVEGPTKNLATCHWPLGKSKLTIGRRFSLHVKTPYSVTCLLLHPASNSPGICRRYEGRGMKDERDGGMARWRDGDDGGVICRYWYWYDIGTGYWYWYWYFGGMIDASDSTY